MFLKSLFILVPCFCFATSSDVQSQIKLKQGKWNGELQLNQQTTLPFRMEVQKVKKEYIFSIHNAEEKIVLNQPSIQADSVVLDFPNFHSALKFKINHKSELNGYWINYNKNNNYKIPFTATAVSKNATSDSEATPIIQLSGKWKATFDPSTADAYMAIGIFRTNKNKIYGTFLTETGDYRFLEGTIQNQSFSLSCFDGSHAFHFTGTVENEKINGNFYSGKHFKGVWIAERDENFELRNPDSLTYLVKKEPFTFKLKDVEGNDFTYPNSRFENKVTIIQIMGTWCPNCMDETRFFQELHQKYNAKGLEIISVGYETPKEFAGQAEKIKLLRDRHQLKFTFLVGGTASKSLASQQFSMLNEIISYPTAIILNKRGEVVKVHTGFNGPSTGEIYTKYVEEMIALIESLLE